MSTTRSPWTLRAPGLLALLLLCSPGAAQEGAPALVHFAEGEALPLTGWALSYEYSTRAAGAEALFGLPVRREAPQLLLGKKAHPLAGHTLEIVYGDVERSRKVEGRLETLTFLRAVGVVLVSPDGKRTSLKIEVPDREILAPGADKKTIVLARGVDLVGLTLTGTRRELCLLSFSSLVDCAPSPANRVVRIEFPS